MSQNKIFIRLVIILSMFGVFLALIYFNKDDKKDKSDPVKVIESSIDLKLASTSKIINFDYFSIMGNFTAKVQINEEDIETIRKSLLGYFEREEIIQNEYYIPNFRNVISWWDMDKENVVNCYYKAVDGEIPGPKTLEIWAFIVKQDDDLYYLYLSYH